jgi:hypothetical protein
VHALFAQGKPEQRHDGLSTTPDILQHGGADIVTCRCCGQGRKNACRDLQVRASGSRADLFFCCSCILDRQSVGEGLAEGAFGFRVAGSIHWASRPYLDSVRYCASTPNPASTQRQPPGPYSVLAVFTERSMTSNPPPFSIARGRYATFHIRFNSSNRVHQASQAVLPYVGAGIRLPVSDGPAAGGAYSLQRPTALPGDTFSAARPLYLQKLQDESDPAPSGHSPFAMPRTCPTPRLSDPL